MTVLSKGTIVPNTEKCTVWAMRVFDQWRKERNALSDNVEKCPTNLLEKADPVKVNHWLSYFVVEARREDGKPYPATTLYQLLAGLLRYARSKNKECPNFLDKKDTCFAELTGTCESVTRQLCEQGVGANVKHAEIITPEEEEQLWNSGVVGIYCRRALVRAVFYYVGKAFCLHGGTEQRSLKPSQFVREYSPDRYTYTENGSKNHRGGFGTLNNSNKVVTVYSTDGNPLQEFDALVAKLPPSSDY